MEINRKTVIPISLVITICSIVFWASGVNSKVQVNADDITRLRDAYKEKRKSDEVFQKEAIDRLARIETKLNNQ